MKLKLDENLGTGAVELLRNAGHDVSTVPEENLCSASDKEPVCLYVREGDAYDFMRFPPHDTWRQTVMSQELTSTFTGLCRRHLPATL